MRKLSSRIYIAFLLIVCTSCFDIKEIIFLNSDGTGTYSLVIDMSQSKAMIDMLSEMGVDSASESPKKSPFSEVDRSFDENKSELEEIEGIRNVTAIKDEENYKFGIQFEFLTMYALNKALNRLNQEDDVVRKEQVFFTFEKKTFIRHNTEDFTKKLMNSTGMASDSLNISKLFKDLSYSTVYTMPKKVKSMTNPDAELSDDKRTVSVTYFPFRGEDEPNFSNKIKY